MQNAQGNAFRTGEVNGVAVSGTGTYYGTPVNLAIAQDLSYDLYWGVNVGTFTVWVSNKIKPGLTNDNDWKLITLATAITQPTGSNTGDYVDLAGLPFRWCRLKYVNTSGSDTIHAYVASKGT
jgi:hypothetical protein